MEIRSFARTVGMGKRRTSKSEQYFLCASCADLTAQGKEPTKAEPFNRAIFRILLDLVGADPDVSQASWEQTHQRRQEILYTPALTQGEIIPPARALKSAS